MVYLVGGDINLANLKQRLRQWNGPRQIHANYPTVYSFDDLWIELCCKSCKSNAIINKPRAFFQHLGGFRRHINYSHAQIKLHEVLDHCEGRLISERDVELLLLGKPAVDEQIVMVCNKPGKRAREEDSGSD
jgi:hypothetical protein